MATCFHWSRTAPSTKSPAARMRSEPFPPPSSRSTCESCFWKSSAATRRISDLEKSVAGEPRPFSADGSGAGAHRARGDSGCGTADGALRQHATNDVYSICLDRLWRSNTTRLGCILYPPRAGRLAPRACPGDRSVHSRSSGQPPAVDGGEARGGRGGGSGPGFGAGDGRSDRGRDDRAVVSALAGVKFLSVAVLGGNSVLIPEYFLFVLVPERFCRSGSRGYVALPRVQRSDLPLVS